MAETTPRAVRPATTLRPVRPAAQIVLRGPGEDNAFRAAVAGVLGTEPPALPGTVHSADGLDLLWLGPTEWLAVAWHPLPDAAARLQAALSELPATAVDLGDARAVFEVAGPGARDVLGKGCPLDLHPRAFGPGRCARTQLARATVLLHQIDARPAFRVFARISFTDYVADWLADAAAEFAA